MKKLQLYLLDKWKQLVIVCFVLFTALVLTTCFFAYNDPFHLIPLFLQIIFFLFSGLLFFLKKEKITGMLLLISVIFVFSLIITLIINGYNRHYNTVLTGFICLFGIYFFIKIVPNKINLIVLIFYVCLIVFLFYFILVNSSQIIETIKNKEFNNLRIGEKIAPINMITILFVLSGSLSVYYFLFKKIKIVYKCLVVLFFVLSFLCGVLTGSKQFIVSLIIAFLFELFMFFGKKRWYLSVISSTFIVIAIVFLFTIPVFSTISTRFLEMIKTTFGIGSTSTKTDYSTSERTLMFQEGLFLFSQRPIFGYGLWGFALNSSFGTYSHNTFSNSVSEMGIIGGTSYFLLLFMPLLNLLRRKVLNNRLILVLFSIYFLQCFYGVIYWHKFTYLIIGLAIAVSETGSLKNANLDELEYYLISI